MVHYRDNNMRLQYAFAVSAGIVIFVARGHNCPNNSKTLSPAMFNMSTLPGSISTK